MIEPIPFEATDWASLDTPCFVFDEPELRENFCDFDRAVKAAWSPLARVAYSIKTNPLPWVLGVARTAGCMAEAVSGEELAVALECGFAPHDLIFNGPIKTPDWTRWALDNGVYVNLDSSHDVVTVCRYAEEHPGVKVGVRANIELERFCPGQTVTGERGGRFGFCYENGELARVVNELRGAGADVAGLHMHVTTLSRSLEVYRVLAEHAAAIARTFGLDLRWIDMGGGFYGGGARNEGAYECYAATMAEVLRDAADPQRCALFVEPGGAVVCTPGRYVGKVVDVKDTTAARFVTCELSRINIDHEMKKTSYPLRFVTCSQGTHPRQVLCGYTCMESDRLCELLDAPELAAGDTVAIDFAGAYSMSFTPEFFIERAPAVYARDGRGTCTLVRPSRRSSAPQSGSGA